MSTLFIVAEAPTASVVVKTAVVDDWEGYEKLKVICSCESGLRQFNNDGTVLRGAINPKDVGICQINLSYHESKAKELGFDLFLESGNINYAKWLYDHEGSKPWSWSSSCHHQ